MITCFSAFALGFISVLERFIIQKNALSDQYVTHLCFKLVMHLDFSYFHPQKPLIVNVAGALIISEMKSFMSHIDSVNLLVLIINW